ncbi:rhodanese-like domain-containing protein [Crossiella sp. CA198]|uniref:rhodanese-like domain-containing protein n=1 Tax=Crossiella sp. CA198 TaxID=3455607 RepID=UPI0024959076
MAAHEVPQDAYLLDVREDDEWAAGHAEGAKHIPMGEVVTRLEELPNDGLVHVICRAGGRSARVTAYLNSNGWDAINVDGGMQLWQAAGRPLVGESGAEPTVI